MTRKTGIRRGQRPAGRNMIWLTVVGLNTAITDSTLSADLVADGDWSVSSGKQSATVIAVRGWISVMSPKTAVEVSMAGYIGIQDENATSGSPQSVATYLNEDVMWTHGTHFGSAAITQMNWDIDVKAKRRLHTGTELRYNFIADVTAELEVSFVLRTLLLKNNS